MFCVALLRQLGVLCWHAGQSTFPLSPEDEQIGSFLNVLEDILTLNSSSICFINSFKCNCMSQCYVSCVLPDDWWPLPQSSVLRNPGKYLSCQQSHAAVHVISSLNWVLIQDFCLSCWKQHALCQSCFEDQHYPGDICILKLHCYEAVAHIQEQTCTSH